jgi:integrase
MAFHPLTSQNRNKGRLKGGLYMPRRAKELTPAQIKGLKHPGGERPIKMPVGGVSGLYVQIWPSGAKSWVLRSRFGEWAETTLKDGTIQRGRKKREIGLGAYPDVLLGQARDKARDIRAQIDAGGDPIAERAERREVQQSAIRRQGRTFEKVFEEYAAEKTKEFSTDRYRKQWRRAVEQYAFPTLAHKPVDGIGLDEVMAVLEPIWHDKTETASKLRQKIEAVLSYATVKRYRSGDNPARWLGNLKHLLAAPNTISPAENYPSLQWEDAPRWFECVGSREGMGARALQYQAMTATRSGAVRFATWDEIDLDARIWTIQAGRKASKIPATGKAKRIPLCHAMITLLRDLPRLEGSNLVFWAPRGGALSDATIGKTMRSIHEAELFEGKAGFVDAARGSPAVPHGLRSTFRTWVTECTQFEGDMAETALFHKVGNKVQQAYDRSDMIEKRRHMMAVWGDHLAGREAGNVVFMEAR